MTAISHSKSKAADSLFRIAVTVMLVILTGAIALLILADACYIKGDTILEVLRSANIEAAFGLSIFTSMTTTLIAMIIAVPSAYALSRFPFKGSVVFDVIIDLLIVIPVLVVGVSLLVFFREGSSLADSPFFIFRMVGKFITASADFFVYQKAGIILAQFFCSVPFAVRVIKSTFDQIDPRTEQVALTLGCTRPRAFATVSLPLARHGLVAGAVLCWARAFGLFGPISVVAGAVRQKTEVLSTSIFLEITVGRLEAALAISLIMVAVAFVILSATRVFTGGNLFGIGARQ